MLEFLTANYKKIADHDIELRRQIEDSDKKITVVESSNQIFRKTPKGPQTGGFAAIAFFG
jgi:hypothetical protein